MKDLGLFVTWPHFGTGLAMAMQTAPFPWGPWTRRADVTLSTNNQQFPSPVAGLCPKYNVIAGRITCTVAMNGGSGGTLYFRELNLGPIGKPFLGIR